MNATKWFELFRKIFIGAMIFFPMLFIGFVWFCWVIVLKVIVSYIFIVIALLVGLWMFRDVID